MSLGGRRGADHRPTQRTNPESLLLDHSTSFFVTLLRPAPSQNPSRQTSVPLPLPWELTCCCSFVGLWAAVQPCMNSVQAQGRAISCLLSKRMNGMIQGLDSRFFAPAKLRLAGGGLRADDPDGTGWADWTVWTSKRQAYTSRDRIGGGLPLSKRHERCMLVRHSEDR